MDEGLDDTRDLNDSAYQDDATGKNSARQGMNIPIPKGNERSKAAGALKGAEGAASAAGAAASAAGAAGGAAAKAAERSGKSGNLYTGSGRDADAAATGKSQTNLKKALPVFAILLILVVATGAISFIGQSFQLISLGEQVKANDNKLSSAVYTRTENELARRFQSTDPKDGISDYMKQLFAMYGLDYVETDNGDGTVARALVYNSNSEHATLLATNKSKNTILNALKTTGAVIDNYREISAVPTGEDEIAAAWYASLSVVTAGAWYDDTSDLTYERLGLNPSRFNVTPPNPTDEEVITAAKAGNASEDINNTTGTTYRYVWTKHSYDYCTHWKTNPDGSHSCDQHYSDIAGKLAEIWDWDTNTAIENGSSYDVWKYTTDPYPHKDQTSARTCTKWGSCPGAATQNRAAEPKAFSGDEINTKITSEDEQDPVKKATDNRAILSAFSTNPKHEQGSAGKLVAAGKSVGTDISTDGRGVTSGEDHVATIKSDESVISAITSMIKNKTTNLANDVLNAVDKTKAGNGGMEMSYYGNLLNTPAKTYNSNNDLYSDIAATESLSFNSWFSDNVTVPAEHEIVKKYNIAKSMTEKEVTNVTIDNDLVSNYNNIENTSSNNRITENMSNSPDDTNPDHKDYYYCEYMNTERAPRGDLCPYSHQMLDPDNYRVSGNVAAYTYALTSIDLIKEPGGEEAAVALNEGISLLDDSMLKQSGGTYGDEEQTLNSYRMQQTYMAKRANFERQTKSPFDPSSTNTFLGSIVSSLLPYATSIKSNALFSTIAATTKVIGSSISSLLPKAAAGTLDELLYIQEETTKDCVANITGDMLCDAQYGNPISTMAQDYMGQDVSMEYIYKSLEKMGYADCDAEGACTIKKDDKEDDTYSYVKWALCTQNDTAINNNITTETNVKVSAAGGILQGVANFLKSIWDALTGWISSLFGKGESNIRIQTSCGGNYGREKDENSGKKDANGKSLTVSELYKIYGQFDLDQRIKALMKETDESASTAFLRDYYKEHPLDQSYEGIIARQSGLTIAEVQQVFAQMEYTVYIALYSPSSRYQFVEPELTELDFELSQTDRDTMKTAAIVAKMRDAEELKDKNFAA